VEEDERGMFAFNLMIGQVESVHISWLTVILMPVVVPQEEFLSFGNLGTTTHDSISPRKYW